MSKPQKHTIGSFLRAVYPGMPDIAAASKSETEVIMDATCELNRIRALVIRDRDGRVVTQGAFNVLECRYYEQLTGLSDRDTKIARLRSLLTRWYHADGTFAELSPEDVIEKRKAAAKELARIPALEKVAEIAAEFVDPKRCGINTLINLRAALKSAEEGKMKRTMLKEEVELRKYLRFLCSITEGPGKASSHTIAMKKITSLIHAVDKNSRAGERERCAKVIISRCGHPGNAIGPCPLCLADAAAIREGK